MAKVRELIATIARKADAHKPAIMVVGGVIGMVGTTVLACRATLHIEEVVDDHKAKIEEIETGLENKTLVKGNDGESVEYTEELAAEDKRKVYGRTIWRFVKLFAPVAALGGLSIAAILGGFKIEAGRHMAAAASAAALETAYDKLVERGKEEFGEEFEKRVLNGEKREMISSEEVDDDGNITMKDEEVITRDPAGKYIIKFERGCNAWDRNDYYNRTLLDSLERELESKLKYSLNGTVPLAEVYNRLGVEIADPSVYRTVWIRKADDGVKYPQGKIQLTVLEAESRKEMIEWSEPVYYISCNCDGLIENLINEKSPKK